MSGVASVDIPVFSAMDSACFESLQAAPAVIVEQGDLSRFRQVAEMKKRTRQVGEALADFAVMDYYYEYEAQPFGTCSPDHFDGVLPRFYQLNTSTAIDKQEVKGIRDTSIFGTLLEVSIYKLPEPDTINKIYNRSKTDPPSEREYKNSQVVARNLLQDDEPQKTFDVIRDKFGTAPELIYNCVGFVAAGNTAVWVNGSGFDDLLFVHRAKSARKGIDGSISYSAIRRHASMSRVVKPRGLDIEKTDYIRRIRSKSM